MADCLAQGRLGTELRRAPLYLLWALVNFAPPGSHELRGDSLQVIIDRIAELTGEEATVIKTRVVRTLEERKALEARKVPDRTTECLRAFHPTVAPRWLRAGGWSGGAQICQILEEEGYPDYSDYGYTHT